jgi:uncharacterized phage protein gp47/JayE
MAGLTLTGLTIATFEEVRAAINEDLRSAFGTSIRLDDSSFLGQLVAIFAERIATVWELSEAINSAQDPDGATGANLDALAALTGTQRLAATQSTVVLTLTGTPATFVPSGSRASTASTEQLFETTEDATIAALTAWVALTPYALGDRRTNASRAYVVTIAGTSAGAGGPTTTASAIVDGSVTWRYMGEGTGADDAESQAVETGQIVAVSGDITEIETPVGGWQSVINLLDADEGRDQESDEDLRVRREVELAGGGTATVGAIRARLLELAGVTDVTVFDNPSDSINVDGMPPHSVEALVQGGDDQEILDTLLASVAAGIQTTGTESGTSTDSQGFDHAVEFSRPDEIDIWIDVTLIKDPDVYPLDGDTQIKAAIVAMGDAVEAGKNAVASQIIAAVFTVPGVLDVTDIDLGTAPAPSGSVTIPIAFRELAVYDTSRITVATSDGVP